MLLYGTGNVIVTVSNMLLVLLVTKHFAAGAGVLGVVDALAGVGVAVAAAVTPFLQKRVSLLKIVAFGYIANACFIALQPQFSITWLMVFFPLGAVCFGLARISCRTLMFNTVPSEYTGRFFGFSNAVGLTSAVVLTYVIGGLVDGHNILVGMWRWLAQSSRYPCLLHHWFSEGKKMKLLAIEVGQFGSYYNSRYEQVEAYGAELFVLSGVAESDHWKAGRFFISHSMNIDDLVRHAKLLHQDFNLTAFSPSQKTASLRLQ